MEELRGIIIRMARIALDEFNEKALEMGISDMSYLLEENSIVTDEVEAFGENLTVL